MHAIDTHTHTHTHTHRCTVRLQIARSRVHVYSPRQPYKIMPPYSITTEKSQDSLVQSKNARLASVNPCVCMYSFQDILPQSTTTHLESELSLRNISSKPHKYVCFGTITYCTHCMFIRTLYTYVCMYTLKYLLCTYILNT